MNFAEALCQIQELKPLSEQESQVLIEQIKAMVPNPELTVSGTPPYRIGETVEGFAFDEGKEISGKIVEIKPVISFVYVLDSGGKLGPADDIYGKVEQA